jgi:hypothetical protein
VHLEADCAGAGLAFALPRGVFAKIRKVLFADAFEGQVFLEFFGAAGVYMNLEVHLGLAMEAFEIALKLALIGTYGLAQALIVLKDGSEPERKYGGMLEAVRDNSGVIHSGFLI